MKTSNRLRRDGSSAALTSQVRIQDASDRGPDTRLGLDALTEFWIRSRIDQAADVGGIPDFEIVNIPVNRAINRLRERGDWPHPRPGQDRDELMSDPHVIAAFQVLLPNQQAFEAALDRYVGGE